MKTNRIISGLTALLIASSYGSVYAGSDTKHSLSLSDYISYFQNNYAGDAKDYDFDINKDNNINILDMIYAKSTSAGETKIEEDKTTVEYLNYAAADIADAADSMIDQIYIGGITLSKSEYSSEDLKNVSLTSKEREMIEYINETARFHGVEKWSVVFDEYGFVKACIVADEIVQRTGAYPVAVPCNLNIPFGSDLTDYASKNFFAWKKDFGKFISSDPKVSSRADYSELQAENKIARDLFTSIQEMITNFDNKGLEYPEGIISSDDKNDFVQKIAESNTCFDSVKWKARIDYHYGVEGIVIEISDSNHCRTYPNAVPDIMDIPYSDKLLDYACDMEKDWTKDFSEYISTDPQRLKYAEINENITTKRLNEYAKALFTAVQETITDLDNHCVDFDVESEEFDSEVKKHLSSEVLNSKCILKYIVKDGYATGAAVVKNDATGVYPNSVPNDMRIPYSTDVLNYLSDSPDVWKEKFGEYIIETVETEQSPNSNKTIDKIIVNTLNANAKQLFSAAQEMAVVYKGKLPEGVVTSDDDSDFVKRIKSLIDYFPQYNEKWAVYISDGEVKGAVYSSVLKSSGIQYYDFEKEKFVYMSFPYEKTDFTGSYPNSVPADIDITYDSDLVKYYAGDSTEFEWENISKENSGKDSETQEGSSTEELSRVSSALVNTYNANAQTIYSSVSMVLLEHELFGEPVPDGLVTSDDNSEISSEISSSVVGGIKGKWAVYIYNGNIIGVVFSENGTVTGSYPSAVSAKVKYDHSLVLKYKDNSMNW